MKPSSKHLTRGQMAASLGMSRTTFYRRMKNFPLKYTGDLLSPAQQAEIREYLDHYQAAKLPTKPDSLGN